MSAVHAEKGPESAVTDNLEGRLRATIRFGSGTALGLILIGLVLATLSGRADIGVSMAISLADLLEAGRLFTPEGILNLGLLALLGTPVLCIVMAVLSFVSGREWRYGAVSIAVLVVIVVGLLASI